MGVLRTLLIIVLVYYGLRLLYRIFAPVLLRYASRKVQQQFNEKYGRYQQESPRYTTKEGEVTIDKQPSKKKKSNKHVGEYIDFEEVE